MLGRATLIWGILVCVLAAAQVWLPHLRGEVAQHMAVLQKEKSRVQQDVQGLRLELASLMRPNSLRRLAHQTLGMRAPQPQQVIRP